MKPTSLILLSFTLLQSCGILKMKEINRLSIFSPNEIKINDSFFVDRTEVCNLYWREFLKSNRSDSSFEISNYFPDTTIWYKYRSLDSITRKYYSSNDFDYYPVVGISYEQALKYCNWKTKAVNTFYKNKPSLNPFPNKKIQYNLPTVRQWEIVAEDIGIDKNLTSRDYLANVKRVNSDTNNNNFTVNVKSFKQNKYGIYNMIGNVSEMTLQKGISKGGNFFLPIDSCKTSFEQHYEKPEIWLGFRCICEIVNLN